MKIIKQKLRRNVFNVGIRSNQLISLAFNGSFNDNKIISNKLTMLKQTATDKNFINIKHSILNFKRGFIK